MVRSRNRNCADSKYLNPQPPYECVQCCCLLAPSDATPFAVCWIDRKDKNGNGWRGSACIQWTTERRTDWLTERPADRPSNVKQISSRNATTNNYRVEKKSVLLRCHTTMQILPFILYVTCKIFAIAFCFFLFYLLLLYFIVFFFIVVVGSVFCCSCCRCASLHSLALRLISVIIWEYYYYDYRQCMRTNNGTNGFCECEPVNDDDGEFEYTSLEWKKQNE